MYGDECMCECACTFIEEERETEKEIYAGLSGALLAARLCNGPMTREGSVYNLFS